MPNHQLPSSGTPLLEQGRADLHVHSLHSDGHDAMAIICQTAMAAGLSVIAITDHDRLDGALEAQTLVAANGWPLEIVVGEEIGTQSGHLLGLFLSEVVPAGLSLNQSLQLIAQQGGLAVAAHPLVPHPKSISARAIERSLAEGFNLTALESHNPTPGARLRRGQIQRLAFRHRLALTGGSDAHSANLIGRAQTRFAGQSALELRAALETATTSSEGSDQNLLGLAPIMLRFLQDLGDQNELLRSRQLPAALRAVNARRRRS